MIAKITRGTRVGDIGAYLHGPGKANEHTYRDTSGATRQGGIVIASNLGAEGHTSPESWAKEIRAAHNSRPEIVKPIWHASLRNTANDRIMSDQEWADAGQTFAERMGFDDHPWVMVRHGDDHIHIVVSRVNDEGAVWHARNDRRQAQTACTELEHTYGLEHAPRQRTQPKTPTHQVHHQHQESVKKIATRRADAKRMKQIHTASFTGPPRLGKPQTTTAAQRANSRTTSTRRKGRDFER